MIISSQNWSQTLGESIPHWVILASYNNTRIKDLAKQAIDSGKDVLIETVFNDVSFKDIADYAKNVGYQTSLVVLFLDSLQQSITRVALRVSSRVE